MPEQTLDRSRQQSAGPIGEKTTGDEEALKEVWPMAKVVHA